LHTSNIEAKKIYTVFKRKYFLHLHLPKKIIMQKQTITHSGLAILACLLWSTAFVGIKIGLQHTTPLQFAGLRFFLSGILLLPFVKSRSIFFASVKNTLA